MKWGAAIEATIQAIMSTRVVSVSSDATIERMQALLDSQGFHHLIVAERGRIVGVVSDRDLLRHISPWARTPSERRADEVTLHKRAHQVMTRQLVTVEADDAIIDAIGLMLEHTVSCLPVVGENEHCIGVVTWRDVLRWTSEQLALSALLEPDDGETQSDAA